MNRAMKERLKTFILAILVLSSLVQVGSLWYYQNHGFPFNILSSFLHNSSVNASGEVSSYLKPMRMIISQGYDGFHWIVYRNRDEYNKIWEEAKSYLAQIQRSDYSESGWEPFTETAWERLVTRKVFILDFKTAIKPEVFSLLSDSGGTLPAELAGISKMVLYPTEDINNNMTVYLLDSAGGKIFSYVLPMAGHMNKSGYKAIVEKLKNDAGIKGYGVIAESNFLKRDDFSINNDVLIISADRYKYADIRDIRCDWPEIFKVKKPIGSTELDSLASGILGAEKDSYVPAEDTNYNAYVFKNINNTYRIYEDGLLEYKRTTVLGESNKESMKDAFINAVDFIGKKKNLIEGVDLYLADIRESKNKNSYIFAFDYMVGETPVVFNKYDSRRKEGGELNNAITIEATSSGVSACSWIVKEFVPVKQSIEYNMGFTEFLSSAYRAFKENEAFRNKSLHIKDINISYRLTSSENNQIIRPSWLITTTDGNLLPAEIEKR